MFFLLPFSEALPGGMSAIWSLAAIALVIGTVVFGQGRRPLYDGLWPTAAFLALAGVVSSSGAADGLRGHLIIGAQVFLFMSFGPFALRRLASAPRLSRIAVGAFLLGQSISAGVALAQASGVIVLGWKTENGRAPGLASHPNILGVLSGVAIVAFLYLLFRTEIRKIALIVGLAANVGGLLVSGSISSLSACILGVLVFMAAARVSMKVPVIMSVVCGAVLWVVAQLSAAGLLRGPAQRIAQVTGQTTDASTLDIRQNTYAFAWNSIQRDPLFGRGLDSSSGATFDNVTLTHNILLRTWFQGGLSMGIAFALVVGAVAIVVIRSVVKGQNAAAAGVLTVVVGFSLTSAALQQGYFWLLIFGAWALIEPQQLRRRSGAPVAQPFDVGRGRGVELRTNLR